jgi:hypothetical protein
VSVWRPNTEYAAGARVLSPLGLVVSAKAAFTSSATYSPSQWNTVTTVRRRIHVFACDGQSNMSGRGIPYSAVLDPANPRIKQFPGRGASAGTIVAAAEPLTMHDAASGIGPAFQFARRLLATLPPDDVILLVPNAHGGTMLPTDASPLGWRWGIAGNLSAQAVVNTKAALVAAAAAYPDAEIVLEGVLWLEGETAGTNSTPGTVYQADLDALIAGYRGAYDIPDLPFIMGGMVVEALSTGTRTAINTVHSDTPYRVPGTGWSPGYAGVQNGDNLHYNAAGQVKVGSDMFSEFQRVKAGLRPVHPSLVVPPVTVPVPGATIAEDTFNRADVDEVTATDTVGKSWTKTLLSSSTVKAGIRSNEMAPVYTTTGGSNFETIECLTSVVQLQWEFSVINSSFRAVFRWVDANNYLVLVMDSATTVSLRKYVAGVATTLKTFMVASSTAKTVVALAKADNTVSVWVDGVSVLVNESVTDFASATQHGVQIVSTSAVAAGRLNRVLMSQIAA